MKIIRKFKESMESLTKRILAYIAEAGQIPIDAFFPRGRFGTAPVRKLVGLPPYDRFFRRTQKRSVSAILSRLRAEGLVVREGSKRQSLWHITSQGRRRLRRMGEDSASKKFLPPADNIVRIVSFDIPEKERVKRNWLRLQLLASDFKPLQKSVWIGKRPLPEELIKRFDDLSITSYVHVISIDRKGTLIDY